MEHRLAPQVQQPARYYETRGAFLRKCAQRNRIPMTLHSADTLILEQLIQEAEADTDTELVTSLRQLLSACRHLEQQYLQDVVPLCENLLLGIGTCRSGQDFRQFLSEYLTADYRQCVAPLEWACTYLEEEDKEGNDSLLPWQAQLVAPLEEARQQLGGTEKLQQRLRATLKVLPKYLQQLPQ